jgi:hypothetical protein
LNEWENCKGEMSRESLWQILSLFVLKMPPNEGLKVMTYNYRFTIV